MGGPVRGHVRRGLGRVPGDGVRAAEELGIVPADAELPRHDPDVPDWASLPPAARRLFSRMMEVFAGFLSHADHQVGRLIEFLRGLGELDNEPATGGT